MVKRFWFRASGLALCVAIAAVAALYACGSSSKSTSPVGGGGGGGGVKELNSGDISPGGTFNHTFHTAGSYGYHCIHHSPMVGTVTVVLGGASAASVNFSSPSSPFPAASVDTGGTVTWHNNGTMNHTVTSD